MSAEQGAALYNFIRDRKLRRILELGTKHGVGTCHLANAVVSLGGSVTTVDLLSASKLEPSVSTLTEQLGLNLLVEAFFEPVSYTWRLANWLQQNEPPQFDLCYLDGGHTFETDGLAFLLVTKLLVPGGWLILDDLNWSFGKSPTLKTSQRVLQMHPDERNTCQVRMVWDMLVRKSEFYSEQFEQNGWGFARRV